MVGVFSKATARTEDEVAPARKRLRILAVFAAAFVLAYALLGSPPADAAAGGANAIDGNLLSLWWVLPFAGLLLSIALFPLAAPHIWHRYYGTIAALWALAFILPFLMRFGGSITLYELLHTILLEYIPFIILITALFTIAGGIYVSGNLRGSPVVNTAMLAVGMVLASLVGTTGASMVMIRPVIRANDDRRHNVHVIVFFIFLVSNIGGSLTPLGDPPLFLGFLKGVDFFWPTQFMLAPMLIVSAILLGIFFLFDSYLYAREGHDKSDPTPDSPIAVHGLRNVPLLLLLIGAVLLSGSGLSIGSFEIYGLEIQGMSVLRDVIIVLLAAVSLSITPDRYRKANNFSWEPCLEVAKLFAAIFITIIPAIAILRAGETGAMGFVLQLLTDPDGSPNNAMYFWLTGVLSSFLDNAPTYLVFFNAAGGDAQVLMGPLSQTLLAISAGAVFMGANTYIGNAPNFMVKAIAEHSGIRMPSFFGYMLWSGCLLLPCFILVTVLFF